MPEPMTQFLFYIQKLFWGVQAKPGIRCRPLNTVMLKCQQSGNQRDIVENSWNGSDTDAEWLMRSYTWRTLKWSNTERDSPTNAGARISSQLHPSRRTKKLFPILHTPEVSQVSLKIQGDRHKLTKHTKTTKAEGMETQKEGIWECTSRQPHIHMQRQGDHLSWSATHSGTAVKSRYVFLSVRILSLNVGVTSHLCLNTHAHSLGALHGNNLNILKPICLHSSFTRQLCCFE